MFFDSCAVTNSNGEYTISGLPEGSFTVSFSGEDCQSSPCTMENYILQYYNGVPSSTEATQVPVLANANTPGSTRKWWKAVGLKDASPPPPRVKLHWKMSTYALRRGRR